MKRSNIEAEIEATLTSLDKIQRVESPPFFYSRLQQKMAADKPSSLLISITIFSRPMVAVAALFIFIVLNSVAISNVWQQKHKSITSPAATLNSFAKDYDLGISTVYEQ